MRFIILLLLALVFPAGNADGAQAIGGKFALGGKPSAAILLPTSISSCDIQTNVTSISVGVNSLGANRRGLAIVQFDRSTQTVTSVGTGAQSYTLLGTADGESIIQASVWHLAAPALGTQTVTAQFDAEVGAVMLCVLSFENVHQSTAPTFVKTSGTSGPVNLSIASATGNLVIDVFVSAQNFVNASDDTEIIYTNPGSQIATRIGSKPGAGTVSWTMSLLGSNAWNAAMINISKAP